MENEGGIGPYRIEAEIARSSLCSIYRAYEESLDRPVLIKKLHPQMAREEDIRKRFEREAQVCARVKHENIVDIYSYRADPEVTMLVMEFVEGRSLGELISKRGPIDWRTGLTLLAGVLKGLAHAHSKGVTHRDIKPDNLLVSDSGVIKITDFGLATIADAARVTMQGSVVGTPAYLPPEQVSGGQFDQRGDIFSLGVTIYETITGVSPFSGSNFSETLKKILTLSPPGINALVPDVPPELSQIVERMLEKQPSKRYPTADQVLEDVKRLALQYQVPLEAKTVLDFLIGGGDRSATPVPISSSTVSIYQPAPKKAPAWIPLAAALLLAILLWALPMPDLKSFKNLSLSDSFRQEIASSIERSSEARLKQSEPIPPQAKPPARSPEVEQKPVAEKNRIINTVPTPVKRNEETKPQVTGPGTLVIKVQPWATVSIDNVSYGDTPISDAIRLESGRHMVVLSNPEFPAAYVEMVEIESGGTVNLDINLWNKVGLLKIVSVKPWAEIFVNDVSYGMTPRAKPIILPFGRHVVELRNPGHHIWRTEIDFDPRNREKDIAVTLTPL